MVVPTWVCIVGIRPNRSKGKGKREVLDGVMHSETSFFPTLDWYHESVNTMVQKVDLINSFTKAFTTNQQSTEALPTEDAEACLDIDRPHIQIFAILMYLRNKNRVGLEIFNTFQVIEDTVRGSTKEGPTDLEKGQGQSQAGDVAMNGMALAPDRHER